MSASALVPAFGSDAGRRAGGRIGPNPPSSRLRDVADRAPRPPRWPGACPSPVPGLSGLRLFEPRYCDGGLRRGRRRLVYHGRVCAAAAAARPARREFGLRGRVSGRTGRYLLANRIPALARAVAESSCGRRSRAAGLLKAWSRQNFLDRSPDRDTSIGAGEHVDGPRCESPTARWCAVPPAASSGLRLSTPAPSRSLFRALVHPRTRWGAAQTACRGAAGSDARLCLFEDHRGFSAVFAPDLACARRLRCQIPNRERQARCHDPRPCRW